ncbi:MAG: hypothetical protein IK104_07165 [Clostridia bacterium]|nr:hypothetical protein [Clostridia bacterium]
MTESVFRDHHSRVIEYYQLIEMRLRGACAVIYADNHDQWYAGLDTYENDSFGALIHKIRTSQKETNRVLFSEDDLACLDGIRQARNFWCHACFGGEQHVKFKKSVISPPEYAKKLEKDLRDAIEWDEKLAEIHGEAFSQWRNAQKHS